eukprot:scaffold10040_cov57-Phaeocystis_antarctica.AAC.4
MCVRYACCSLPTLGSATLSACGAADPAPAEARVRGSAGSSMPCLSYTVRTEAKESDQLMSSACRTSTTWRSRRGLGLAWG